MDLVRACAELGVTPSASLREAKRAYRKLVKRWHPDRFARSDAQAQAEATLRLQRITEAYQVIAHALGPGAQLAQEAAHLLAVVPLLGLDARDVGTLLGVGRGARVASVRIAGGALARIGVLEDADQPVAGGGGVVHLPTIDSSRERRPTSFTAESAEDARGPTTGGSNRGLRAQPDSLGRSERGVWGDVSGSLERANRKAR